MSAAPAVTGYQVASALRASYDVHVELATHATIVLVLGIGQPVEPLDRVAHDLAETVRRIAAVAVGRRDRLASGPSVLTQPPAELGVEQAVTPRDAFLGRERSSAGRATRSAASRRESIAGYPPGVPTLLPGERVTAEVIAYLRALTAAGARLHGAADPSFRTLRVLVAERASSPAKRSARCRAGS